MRPKLLATAVVVVLAFLLATNPVVSQAAGQITGKQIKNSTVTGRDIKNLSLTGKDLKAAAITSTQLADGSVAPGKVADNSITGAEIADQTLTGSDIDTRSLPVVHRIVVRQVNGSPQAVAPGSSLQAVATCQQGETVVAGGAYSSSAGLTLYQSWPDTTSNRWIVVATNDTASTIASGQVIAFASCAS